VTRELKVLPADDIELFNQVKNDKNRKQKLIGTHNDNFHCDEVLATVLLLYTNEFSDSIIYRTRNEEVLT
jgi:hypothetical protein